MSLLPALLCIGFAQLSSNTLKIDQIREMLRYVPQSEPVSLNNSPNLNAVIAKPTNGGKWWLSSELLGEPRIIIYGSLPNLPSEIQVQGLVKALDSVFKENWRLPLNVSFTVDGDRLYYSIVRVPRVVGGGRLIQFNKKTKKLIVSKDR